MWRRIGWQGAMWAAELLVCLWMATDIRPTIGAQADTETRTAVLETRANQIDAHLTATDASVERLEDTVQSQGNTLSEMQGEERAAFAILTLLTAGNFVVQLRSKNA